MKNDLTKWIIVIFRLFLFIFAGILVISIIWELNLGIRNNILDATSLPYGLLILGIFIVIRLFLCFVLLKIFLKRNKYYTSAMGEFVSWPTEGKFFLDNAILSSITLGIFITSIDDLLGGITIAIWQFGLLK
jgi:hypothetical protein